jgi:hypothetical protein
MVQGSTRSLNGWDGLPSQPRRFLSHCALTSTSRWRMAISSGVSPVMGHTQSGGAPSASRHSRKRRFLQDNMSTGVVRKDTAAVRTRLHGWSAHGKTLLMCAAQSLPSATQRAPPPPGPLPESRASVWVHKDDFLYVVQVIPKQHAPGRYDMFSDQWVWQLPCTAKHCALPIGNAQCTGGSYHH